MERITLGHVSGVYGIKGWLRITPQTRPAERILEYRRWWIGDEQGFMSRVVSHRMQGNGLVVELLGRDEEPITDRAIAQTMIGKSISVLRSEMPPLAEGEYYWVDLLGLKVLPCCVDSRVCSFHCCPVFSLVPLNLLPAIQRPLQLGLGQLELLLSRSCLSAHN